MILLLRGINLGPRNRIAMPELREAFAEAGYDAVRTHLQSGNVVLASRSAPDKVAREAERLIAARFGLDIQVLARTRAELAEVVQRDPLANVAEDPRRYQVTFLARAVEPEVVRKLEAIAAPEERLVAIGREIYAWHAAGIARSKLWAQLAGKGLGVPATARNWTTVTKLLELASG